MHALAQRRPELPERGLAEVRAHRHDAQEGLLRGVGPVVCRQALAAGEAEDLYELGDAIEVEESELLPELERASAVTAVAVAAEEPEQLVFGEVSRREVDGGGSDRARDL